MDLNTPSQKWPLLATAILGIITLLVFSRALSQGYFELDDPAYVQRNAHVLQGFTWQGFCWAWSLNELPNYHPLTMLSHMLDIECFGINPRGHHLTSILIHVANSLLLLSFLKRLTKQFWPSFIVASLFAIHPLRVESVVWIAERKDVLSMFFGLLTLLAYQKYVGKKTRKRYALILFFFVASLLSKSMMVTLPCVMLLLDFWPLNRLAEKREKCKAWFFLLLEKTPLFACSLAISIVTMIAQHRRDAMSINTQFPLTQRASYAAVDYVRYLEKIFWPINLSVYYPYRTWSNETVALALLFLFAITVATLYWIKSKPYLIVGWFWFLGTMLPVIGIIHVGNQSIADRYTYLPSIGLSIAVVWLIRDWLANKTQYRKIITTIITPAILLALSITTWYQTCYWDNFMTNWQHTRQVTVPYYKTEYLLGLHLMDQGKKKQAAIVLERASSMINSKTKAPKITLHYELAKNYLNNNMLDHAAKHYLLLIQYKPNNPTYLAGLAMVYFRNNNLTQAANYFQKAIKYSKPQVSLFNNLGLVYYRQNQFPKAIQCYLKASHLSPSNVQINMNLAFAYAANNQWQKAKKHSLIVLQKNPINAQAKLLLEQAIEKE